MSDFVFPPAPVPSVPVVGGGRFPVRRIFCVGRNYAAHAREMGWDPTSEPPIFFTKPADAVVTGGADVPYPSATADLHHEVELVLALGDGARPFGWAVGVDLTRRDLQNAAKAAKSPWDAAKGFDASAPLGAITPGPAPTGRIRLSVNGQARQDADLSEMIWSPEAILQKLADLWEPSPGDLVFTGTPEGVAALVRGDRVEASVDGLAPLAFRVV